MLRRSRIYRGEKNSPFPDKFEDFADAAIPELQELLNLMRTEFGKRPNPTYGRIPGFLKAEIEANPGKYRTLLPELPQFIGWVESLPAHNPDAAATLLVGDFRARGFFLLWYSYLSGRSFKDIQNELSKRRTLRSKSTSAKIQKKPQIAGFKLFSFPFRVGA